MLNVDKWPVLDRGICMGLVVTQSDFLKYTLPHTSPKWHS